MLKAILNFLNNGQDFNFSGTSAQEAFELKVAVATLLWLVSCIDGDCQSIELENIADLMVSKFELPESELQEISELAEIFVGNQTFDSFVLKVRSGFSRTQRKKLLELSREVALADQNLSAHEANLLERLREALL